MEIEVAKVKAKTTRLVENVDIELMSSSEIQLFGKKYGIFWFGKEMRNQLRKIIDTSNIINK